MALLSRPSSAARTALIYITLGTLILVWAGIWYVWIQNHNPVSEATYYICVGSLLTGLAFLVIGLALGRIGRAARHAELPPPEITDVEANATQAAAARAPIVAPVNPAVQGTVPLTGGAAVVPGQPAPSAGQAAANRNQVTPSATHL